ncbi:MAG: F0F1 ATP synthase subunit A [Candidatus Saccharimonadales bacterium]
MIRDVLLKFAVEGGPSVHITPGILTVFHGYIITNSIFYAWICFTVISIVLIGVARRVTIRPQGGLIQIIEIGSEFITNLIASSLGDRKKALKYAPFFVTFFFIIAFSNLLGLLPGVGEALTFHGAPLFRAFTADINATLAAATVAMVVVQYFAIRESGILRHLRHYFNGSMTNPITILLGIFEMFSELTRVASLALRLFLNVAIGEIIISVFAYLGKFAAPLTSLPFVTLELFVGILQAYIFVMLTIMYLAVAIKHDHEDDTVIHESVPSVPQPQGQHG